MFAIPTATYRLQFSKDFTFRDARRLIPYLRDLGISHVYASPLLKSRPGSTHGYDVADPGIVDPEIGTEEEFFEFADELRENGLSIVLDIVPNHMAADVDNPWWLDVLKHGPASDYSGYFDIDWDAQEGKLLLPLLGAPLEEVMANGELEIVSRDGEPFIRYFETELPVAPGSEGGDLREVLERQHYRLEFWRTGSQNLNYRRFFDITELVSLREEEPEVFHRAHERVLTMIRNQRVTGLRIDHIDGLRDPRGYLERLQLAARANSPEPEVPFYVVVEKILGHGEDLPAEWACAGTSGYDFLNTLNGLFVDPAGIQYLDETYHRFIGRDEDYSRVAYESKMQVMSELFAGELRSLTRTLIRLAQQDERGRSIPPEDLRRAFLKVTAALPVYRTYTRDNEVSQRDRDFISAAVRGARTQAPDIPEAALDFVRRVATLDSAEHATEWLEWALRWQQFTGPITAKGIEDTAFYRFNRLLSMNEVGAEPEHGVVSAEEFHDRNRAMVDRWPHTMNATSTHDTKRSEDVRARLNVLSEIPEQCSEAVGRWAEQNARHRVTIGGADVPDRNEEYAIYQTLAGAWPLQGVEKGGFRDRVHGWLEKALREKKTHSSWLEINEPYERACHQFLDAILADEAFLRDFQRFQARIQVPGAVNSLAQVVLKAAAPGVPDFYQGTELWDFSLVDPDNRRPVDFGLRADLLGRLEGVDPGKLLDSWQDGRVKLLTTALALRFRNRHPDLFASGEYLPLDGGDHAVAFARRLANTWTVAVVPRLTAATNDGWPLGEVWRDAIVPLPPDAPAGWRDVFTGQALVSDDGRLRLADVFARFPVALLAATP